MLTAERAREIHEKQKVFPYWGNYRKFMTLEEEVYVMNLFYNDPNPNVTVAGIVQRIAREG